MLIMRNIIENIIKLIEKGKYFDSHFIIDTIIKDYSDDYLEFAANHPAKSKRTEYVHSELAKIISSFEGDLVKQHESQSYSYNIRGKASFCALWERI